MHAQCMFFFLKSKTNSTKQHKIDETTTNLAFFLLLDTTFLQASSLITCHERHERPHVLLALCLSENCGPANCRMKLHLAFSATVLKQRLHREWGHAAHRGWARFLLNRRQELIVLPRSDGRQQELGERAGLA
jgi:hypothetical protein